MRMRNLRLAEFDRAVPPVPSPGSVVADQSRTAYPTAVPTPPPPTVLMQDPDTIPMRKLAVSVGLMLIFVRFSMVPEVMAYLYGVPGFVYYILYSMGVVTNLMTGGFRRLGETRLHWPWFAFLCWMILVTPMSSWIGGSAELVANFIKGATFMLILTSISFVSWKEFRGAIKAMALGYIVIIFVSQILNADRGGRMSLSFGTIGNSNDLAAHLLLAMPAMLFVVLSSASKAMFRLPALIFVAMGIYVVLASGSRGALLSLLAMAGLYLLLAPGRARLMAVPVVGAGIFLAVLFMKESTLKRLTSMFSSEQTAESTEAQQSSERRQQMIRNGLTFVKAHPFAGVGPAQFSNYNGKYGNEIGERTYWANAHNSYLTAAAEMGVPGFFFYMLAMLLTLRTFWSVYRATRWRPEPVFQDIALASFCLLIGFVGFAIAIFFLNFTYLFHSPTITGLAICLSRATQRELQKVSGLPAGRPAPPWMPNVRPQPAG